MARTYTPRSKAPRAHEKFVAENKKKSVDVSKMPRREMLIIYYEDRGYKVVSGRTAKYVTMEKPGNPQKRFIGKNGGVRVGTKISDSWGQTIQYQHLPKVVEAILNRGK